MPVNHDGSFTSIPLESAVSTGKEIFMYTWRRLNKSAMMSTSSDDLGYSIYKDLIGVFRRIDSDTTWFLGCMGNASDCGHKYPMVTTLMKPGLP